MPYLLLFVVLAEGFTTLAMQMVALRNAIPLVGSSIILTSVVIGVILLALAVGYRHGGRLTERLSDKKITAVLSRMLFGSGLYYVFLVFPFQDMMLSEFVQQMPYTLALFVFSVLFFFLPVAIASHTMPMITQLTQGSKWFAAGKILFVSTLGSFAGSILTSTVLFPLRGVALTWYVTAGILIICHMALMIYQKRVPRAGIAALIVISVLFIQRPAADAAIVYKYDSPYQKVEIREDNYDGTIIRSMLLNGGYASSIYADTGKSRFGYIREAVDITESRVELSSVSGRKNILVIGAAGFTYPEEMAQKEYVERIDTIDVDPSVKKISEKYFQQRPLHEKITFTSQSARGYLHDAIEDKSFYDTILVDAYNGTSIPEELVTSEFFADLGKLSDSIILNMIMDTKIETDFSRHLMATLQEVRPNGIRYKNVTLGWPKRIGNFIVASRPFPDAQKFEGSTGVSVYRDDKHSVETDKAAMFYSE